jgi:hypothetical protein
MPRTYFRGGGQRVPHSDDKSYRFYKPQWYDPYFFIQGSVPEKMVMKELVRRGIYFEHTPQTNPVQWGALAQVANSNPTNWEPDFLFPQFKIWLEVQGAYFHTLPGIPEKEALRFALIEAAGWRPIYWWDYDIEARLPELMDSVPEFYKPPTASPDHPKDLPDFRWTYPDGSHRRMPRSFGYKNPAARKQMRTLDIPFYEGGMGIDHLKGLRAANRGRATPPQYASKYRRSSTRRAKIRKRWRHS